MNKTKAAVGIAIFVFTAVLPLYASSQSLSERSQRIAELESRILLLQKELQQLQKELEELLLEESREAAAGARQEQATQRQENAFSSAYCYEFKSPYLMIGSRDNTGDTVGNEVTKLQEILAQDKELYPEGMVTGTFGPLTQRAVGRFQERHGIPVRPGVFGYGIFGPQTMKVMKSLCGNAEQKTQNTPALEQEFSPAQAESQDANQVQNTASERAAASQEEGESLSQPQGEELTADSTASPERAKNWIIVESPNGGETFFVGRSYTIAWSSSPAERVNIGVVNSEGMVEVIARDVMNTGKYLWVVPPHFTPGEYKIRIAIPDLANLAVDESDESFVVRAKNLSLRSPMGGEVWLRGGTYEISWESLEIDKVQIDIIDESGDARVLASGLENTDSFSWTVPSDFPVGRYKIRVFDVSEDASRQNPERAESFEYFSIVRPPLPVRVLPPSDATNNVRVRGGEVGVELLIANIQSDEPFVLREIALSDGREGALEQLFSGFALRVRSGPQVALRSVGRNAAGDYLFAPSSPFEISGRTTPLSIRANAKAKGVKKDFTITLADLMGEGDFTMNPVDATGSVSAKISYGE